MDFSMANVSLQLVKKHGYKTDLYVDKANYHKFDRLNFDEKILLDQSILDQFPKNVWSLGKLLSFTQVNEPFFHIDFDLFIIEDQLKHFLNKKFVAYHEEGWMNEMLQSPDPDLNLFQEDIKNAYKDFNYSDVSYENIKSYNCAIIGGTAIDEIKKSANIVLNYAKKEKNYFLNRDSHYKDTFRTSVLFEQILFMNICKDSLNEISIILDEKTSEEKQMLLNLSDWAGLDFIYEEMVRKKVIHLWANKESIMNKLKSFTGSRIIN
jgi:hypothetical protein